MILFRLVEIQPHIRQIPTRPARPVFALGHEDRRIKQQMLPSDRMKTEVLVFDCKVVGQGFLTDAPNSYFVVSVSAVMCGSAVMYDHDLVLIRAEAKHANAFGFL